MESDLCSILLRPSTYIIVSLSINCRMSGLARMEYFGMQYDTAVPSRR